MKPPHGINTLAQIFGMTMSYPEYIEKSFQWAREAGPEETLVFNADNNESPRDANTSHHINLMYKQVKTLKEKGVPDRRGGDANAPLPALEQRDCTCERRCYCNDATLW